MFSARVSIVSVLILSLGAASIAKAAFDQPVPALPLPPGEIIQKSVADNWQYMYTHERGPHTNGAHTMGRIFLLAVSCFSGDTRGDYRLLKQTRFNLQGDFCLVAAGGYAAQHELLFTASCVLIKNTPRLWNQLTEDEKNRMDLLVKAAMVASAYTTSDAGAADKKQNSDMMGGTNLNRGWNPNFREGMIGTMIAATAWFGSAEAAYEFLDNYNHIKFVGQLNKAGLKNTVKTFTAGKRNHKAPNPRQIRDDIRNYSILGRRLDDLMGIYHELTLDTYNGKVNAGLNGGSGINGSGKLASGAAELPNKGKLGMLTEFDSGDAGGHRSSIGYAYSGFRPNLVNQIVLVASGNWESGKLADECVERLKIGIPDLFYKLEHGYIDYSKGHASKHVAKMSEDMDYVYTRSLWYDVMSKFHTGEVTCANAGDDILISESSDTVTVELNAENTKAAPETTITEYKWLNANGEEIATGKNASVTLENKPQKIKLVVTDSTGRTSSDILNIKTDK